MSGRIDARVRLRSLDMEPYPPVQGFNKETLRNQSSPSGSRLVLIQMSSGSFDNGSLPDEEKEWKLKKTCRADLLFADRIAGDDGVVGIPAPYGTGLVPPSNRC